MTANQIRFQSRTLRSIPSSAQLPATLASAKRSCVARRSRELTERNRHSSCGLCAWLAHENAWPRRLLQRRETSPHVLRRQSETRGNSWGYDYHSGIQTRLKGVITEKWSDPKSNQIFRIALEIPEYYKHSWVVHIVHNWIKEDLRNVRTEWGRCWKAFASLCKEPHYDTGQIHVLQIVTIRNRVVHWIGSIWSKIYSISVYCSCNKK